tara:strand:+ start:137431 stop:138558 length:1128 start_codon:yes stop_codon:yes gene_type:complete
MAALITFFCLMAHNAMAEGLVSQHQTSVEQSGFTLKTPPKIAILFYDRRTDGGWMASFETARLKLQKELGLEIAFEQSVTESPSRVIVATERFITEGYNIIIGTGSYYSDTFQLLASRHPDIAFLNAAGSTNAPNLQSFYGRTFDSHYLCGIAASAMSKRHKIGYIAARDVPVVNWGVNGFMLGVRHHDPDGKVMVIYDDDWANPRRETDNTNALIDMGADVIGQHVNTPTPQIIAQMRGVLSTGHHRDMSDVAPDATICSSIWNWNRYLLPELKKIMAGNWHPDPEGALPSFRDGPTDIALNTKLVPEDIQRMVMEERQALIEGKDIFAGPLSDRTGERIIGSGSMLTKGQLLEMNWHMPGIEIYEAPKQEDYK